MGNIQFLLAWRFYPSQPWSPLKELQQLQNLETALINSAEVSPHAPLIRYIRQLSGASSTLGNFSSFPEDIIRRVASFLRLKERNRFSTVCKAIRRILYYPEILQIERTEASFLLEEDPKFRPLIKILHFERHNFLEEPFPLGAFSNIEKITLYNCSHLTSEYIQSISTIFQTIREFYLCGTPVPTKGLETIGYCKEVEEVSIEYVETSEELMALVPFFKNAVQLHLTECPLTKKFAKAVAEHYQNLKEITFSCSHLKESHLITLASRLETVVRLEVRPNPETSFPSTFSQGACFPILGKRCKELQIISFVDCKLNDKNIIDLSPALGKAVEINFSGNDISGSCFSALAKSRPELKKVSFRNCDLEDKYLIDLAPALRHAEVLDLRENHDLTGSGFPALAHCHQLKEVLLKECYSLTDATLELLVPVLKNVRILTLPSSSITKAMGIRLLLECHNLNYVNLEERVYREQGQGFVVERLQDNQANARNENGPNKRAKTHHDYPCQK